MRQKYIDILTPFLKPGAVIQESKGLPSTTIENPDENLKANAYYFGQPERAKEWLAFVHSYHELRERWHAVSGKWDDKVVVDIGCGPGNLLKILGGHPALLIGIDAAPESLMLAWSTTTKTQSHSPGQRTRIPFSTRSLAFVC